MDSQDFFWRMLRLIVQTEAENNESLTLLLPFISDNIDHLQRDGYLEPRLRALRTLPHVVSELNTQVLGNNAFFKVEYTDPSIIVINVGMYSESCDYRVNAVLMMSNQFLTQWVNKLDEYQDHGDLLLLIDAT